MNYGIRRFAGGFGRPLFVSGRPPCMAALQDGRDGVVSVGAHSVRPQRLVFRLLCGARRLGAPSQSVPNFAAKDRFLFYRDLVPGGEFLSQRWERNQRIAGGRLRMSADALIFALPPVPHYEGRSPERSRSFPARKIRSAWVRFFRAHRGPGFAKSAFGAVPLLRLSFSANAPGPVSIVGAAPCGRPRTGLGSAAREIGPLCIRVGEGLASPGPLVKGRLPLSGGDVA